MAEVEKINLGDFDQLLIFKEAVKTKGDKSQIVTTYDEVLRMYGDIEVSPAAESTQNDNVISLERISITTYYVPEVNSKWVIEWLNQIYDIVLIKRVKATVFMKVEAQKMLNNG